jgi:hypothetical protein
MHGFRLAVLAAASLATAALTVQAATPTAAARNPASALRLQRAQIMDNLGFERPLAASFLLVPVGWQTSGGVQWGNQFSCTNGYNFIWGARSPDGTQSVGILPQERWQAANYPGATPTPGCRNANITSLQQYLQQYIATLKPGARMLDFRPRQDLMAKLQYLNSRTPSAMGEFRSWVESGDALFAFNDNGREMRGVITATATFNLSHMQAMSGMQAMDSISAGVFPMFVSTAPNGRLNLGFAEAIRQSILPNPEWSARLAAHNGAINQVALQEGIKRGKIIQEANDYIANLRSATYAETSKSNDRIAHERGNLNRGVQDFEDPAAAGGRVALSNLYDNAWKLNDGTYVLSNDANFDPWQDLKVAGTKLEPTR